MRLGTKKEARTQIAHRLATLCITLGEGNPQIRYQRAGPDGGEAHADHVARMLHERLVQFSKSGGGAEALRRNQARAGTRKPATVCDPCSRFVRFLNIRSPYAKTVSLPAFACLVSRRCCSRYRY